MSNYRNRKLNRLREYDYSSGGWYFVTICVKNRPMVFGEIIDEKMILNQYGKIVERQILWLKQQYPHIQLDIFVVMPNHVHAIINIVDAHIVGTTLGLSLHGLSLHGLSLPPHKIPTRRQQQLLPKLMCVLKTTSSKSIHQCGLPDFQWQRSFHDHIIRGERDYIKIREYIRNNPVNWEKDRNNQNVI